MRRLMRGSGSEIKPYGPEYVCGRGHFQKRCPSMSDTMALETPLGRLVIFEVPQDETSPSVTNRNLKLLDSNGKEIWTVEPRDKASDDPFVGLTSIGDAYYAFTWAGIRCEISLQDGSILNKKWVK